MRIRKSSQPLRSTRSAAGFTLIELLLAIALLLIGIVAVAQMIPTAIRSNFRNRNDSTALIAAQRLLEQIVRQDSTATVGVCPNGNPPGGHYSFCELDGDPIALGQVNPGTANTQDGCPLDATGTQLDFTQPVGNCPAGYTITKQWVWNPTTGTQQNVELRWHVVTMHNGGKPARKVFIAGARSGAPGQGFVVTNLQTVVGP